MKELEWVILFVRLVAGTGDNHVFSAACRLLGSVLPKQNGTKDLVLWKRTLI